MCGIFGPMAKFAFDPPRLEPTLPSESSDTGRHGAFKSFNIKQGDKHIGKLHTESYGKRIEINSVEGLGPNTIGPSHLRSLAKQLKEHHPGAEEASGMRISGAKYKNVDPSDPQDAYRRMATRVKLR